MPTKRLSPDAIDEAYDRIGATPRRYGYFQPSDSSGCGLGVYAIANLGCEPGWNSRLFNVQLRDAGYDQNYRRGFAWGFDGEELDPEHDQDVMSNELFMMGYPDGQAAWERVKHRAKGGCA